MDRMRCTGPVLAVLLLFAGTPDAHQVARSDPALLARPMFAHDKGPVVVIDEAHKNRHTYGGRFQDLAKLLQADGYRVRPLVTAISKDSLAGVDIVILDNPGGWESPDDSLSTDEVKQLVEWVRAGGSLLLICDHMPGPLNAAKMSAALGITEWHDGYVNVALPDSPLVGPIVFWRAEYFPATEPAIVPTQPTGWKGYQGRDAILAKHRITEGRNASERVRSVATFVGSAFRVPSEWQGLLTIPGRAISLAPLPNPGAPLVFTKDTPRISVGGWLQGAVRQMGKGRVGAFGDSALLSAGPASDNRQFTLNLMHWLSRVL